MTYGRTTYAALFLVFLDRLLRSTAGKIYLIVDRLRAHRTAGVAEWAATHHDRIELFYLPRRAPELNADEYLNNDLKTNVHAAGLPRNQQELRNQLERFMQNLAHWPERVRSYFRHPKVQYAAGGGV